MVFPHKYWTPFLDCMPQLFFRPQYVWFPVHLKGLLIPLWYETLVVNWQNWLFTLFHQSRSVLSPNLIVCSSVCSSQHKHQGSALWKRLSPHKGFVMRQAFPLHDVINGALSISCSYTSPNYTQYTPLAHPCSWCFFCELKVLAVLHDDIIKWNHFPRYWPFVRGIHRSPVNSPYKGQWHGALMFSLICVWINGWVNNGEDGDLRRNRAIMRSP